MNARRRVSALANPLRNAASVTECPVSSRSFGGVEPDELDVPGGRGLELVTEQPGQVPRAEWAIAGVRLAPATIERSPAMGGPSAWILLLQTPLCQDQVRHQGQPLLVELEG